MVIDIDAFLDGVDKDKLNDEAKVNKVQKPTLDFQKEVEDKIAKFQGDITGKDFKFLKEIYDEIKKFDEDLPNKFAGIETKGRFALQDLGDKYTDKFSEINKNNAKIISEKIASDISILNTCLREEKFGNALELFKTILKNYSYFPTSFLKERIVLSTQIKEKEIEIYTLLEKYHAKKKEEIKVKITTITDKLKINLKKGNLKDIEASVTKLQMLIDNIPKVLVSMFTKEKVFATRVLIHAENFLVNKYEEEFTRRSQNLDELFDKFHDNYLNKNLEAALVIYNEILIQFKAIPDYFIEKKTAYYKQINKLFGMVNKLVVSNNVSEFMETYEYSKRFDSIKEYLSHIERTKNINFDNLIKIKEKISSYPKKYDFEKTEILGKLNTFLAQYEDVSQEVRSADEISSNPSSTIAQSNTQEDHIIDSNTKPKNDYTKNVLKEIDLNYQRFKQSADPEEVKMLYKKIIFYLNHSPIKPSIRKEVLKKLSEAVKQKKLA